MNLDNLTREQFNSTLPLVELLENSVYYPACGTDGRPMKFCNTRWRDLGVNSFVYCDYRLKKSAVERDIWNTMVHYKPLYMREVRREEYIPEGWQLKLYTTQDRSRYTENFFGDPHPFAIWTVFQRRPDLGEAYGPERFSMLYICGEGLATMQQLYIHHHIAPRMLCFIQCWGFAGNWTDFTDSKLSFRMTLKEHPECMPEFLCFGSFEYIDEVVRIHAQPCNGLEVVPVCNAHTLSFGNVFGQYNRFNDKRRTEIGIIEDGGRQYLLVSVPHTHDSVLYHITGDKVDLNNLAEIERLVSLTRLHDSTDIDNFGYPRSFLRPLYSYRQQELLRTVNKSLECLGLDTIPTNSPKPYKP